MSIKKDLAELQALHDRGVFTSEELEVAKARLLAGEGRYPWLKDFLWWLEDTVGIATAYWTIIGLMFAASILAIVVGERLEALKIVAAGMVSALAAVGVLLRVTAVPSAWLVGVVALAGFALAAAALTIPTLGWVVGGLGIVCGLAMGISDWRKG